MKIIISITFITLLTTATAFCEELSLKNIHADLAKTTEHFSYGLKTKEKKKLKFARLPLKEKNSNEESNELVDLEAQYFDSVKTTRAGRVRRSRVRE